MSPPELMTVGFSHEGGMDMALSQALLRVVARGDRAPLTRIYRPGATVAFGRRDRFRPGFADAAAVARELGFTPLLRDAGGLAAPYDEQSVIVDRFSVEPDIAEGVRERFDAMAAAVADVVRGLGLDARVGAVPGEYCPGEHSVNIAGALKVAGAAQRVVRGAAMVSVVLVVGSGGRLREAVARIYEALELPVDPAVTGSLRDVAPALEVDDVITALRERFTPGAVEVDPDTPLLGAARALIPRHLV
ncbi:MAG: lipoate--protein ligase family protein [Solirubrobacterales bacterium]|nr:lipoate--protein ligase family protein [Solirubrobacterales bacterium]